MRPQLPDDLVQPDLFAFTTTFQTTIRLMTKSQGFGKTLGWASLHITHIRLDDRRGQTQSAGHFRRILSLPNAGLNLQRFAAMHGKNRQKAEGFFPAIQ